MIRFLIVVLAGLSLMIVNGGPVWAQESRPETELTTEFEEKIRPLLEQYCIDCHAPGDSAGLNFLAAKTVKDLAGFRDMYADVVQQMESRSMPPSDYDQPSDEERKLVTDWIKKTLDLKPGAAERISPYVVDVYEDRKGTLWFGTVGDGAARYDGKTLEYFSTEDGLPDMVVTSFAEDKDGVLWAGTHNGVARFDGETFSPIGKAGGLPGPDGSSPLSWGGVQSDKDGNIWVSVGQAVFRSDGRAFTEFKLPIDRGQIESYAIVAGKASLLMEDRDGNLWFGTDGDGVYKFDGSSFTHYTKNDGLCSNNITSIMEDRPGRIWFTCIQSYQPEMTGDGGVCRYDGKTFTQFPEIEGLAKNDIYSIYETRTGDIWIGASGTGAYRYDGNNFTLFSETDRKYWTRNFGVQAIAEDRNGTLWFGFSGGLFRFNGKSFFNITEDGPWTDLASALAGIASGGNEEVDWIHPDAIAAMSALAKDNSDQALSILSKLKQESRDNPAIQEDTINRVGYQLMWTDRLDLAIEVFKLNTHLYPEAFNTFDSLGEGYLRRGDEQLAVRNYKKSLELNPRNPTAREELGKIIARKRFESALVAPEGWMEEVLVVPPGFAPTMSFKGMEHLRLPPEFRVPESDWFLSYLFAIELTEPAELNEQMIGEQLLIYFRGLASGGRDQSGNEIDTEKFSITTAETDTAAGDGEYLYTLSWQEPFVNATPLQQNIRVKIISGKNEYGVVFICGSPQPFGSEVWTELLKIRDAFESAAVPAKSTIAECEK